MEEFNLQPIFCEVSVISLLQMFAGLWPQWSQNVPHRAWCLLILPVHNLLMNRSSWTGNPIIIPFYVLGSQPHPQLHLMRCSLQMFPKGLWFVTEKQSQCLALRTDTLLYGLYHLDDCTMEPETHFQFIKLWASIDQQVISGRAVSLLINVFVGPVCCKNFVPRYLDFSQFWGCFFNKKLPSPDCSSTEKLAIFLFLFGEDTESGIL